MVDLTDLRILDILQHDASTTVAEIGRAVGLSAPPCWKRIQKLEADGVIRKRVTLRGNFNRRQVGHTRRVATVEKARLNGLALTSTRLCFSVFAPNIPAPAIREAG